jgi:hypothetical protein
MGGLLSAAGSITFFVIAALVIAIVALVYAVSKSGSSRTFSIIPFSAGLSTGGILFGTGAAAIAFGFGSTSVGDGIVTMGEIVGGPAFVAPSNGRLKNLFVNFGASGETGADVNVAIFTSPRCNRECGLDLVPSSLAVCGVLSSTTSQFCLRNTCRSVRVRCGDRIALVASTGTLTTDVALLTNLNAGVEFVRES